MLGGIGCRALRFYGNGPQVEVTVGMIFGTGDTIRLFLIFSPYSSKFRIIFLGLTCSAFTVGSAFTRTGGSESLGPPVGGTIFAQPVIKGKRVRPRQTRKKIKNRFMCLVCKLTGGKWDLNSFMIL
jgi:hypothetical protein